MDIRKHEHQQRQSKSLVPKRKRRRLRTTSPTSVQQVVNDDEEQGNRTKDDNNKTNDHARCSSDADYHLQLCWFLSPNDRSELILKWTAVFKAGSGRDPIESIQVYKRIES